MEKRFLEERVEPAERHFVAAKTHSLPRGDVHGPKVVLQDETQRDSYAAATAHFGRSELFTASDGSAGRPFVPHSLHSPPGALVAGTSSMVIRRELLTRGRALLHQQCWLWGQDVKRPEGNLLLHYGFERTRPPAEMTASTQYSLRLDDRLIVRLWGFGFAYGTREEQIYVNRYDFRPRILRDDSDRWEPPGMELAMARDTVLLEAAARWIALYEGRIAREPGERYRKSLLLQWKKRPRNGQPLQESWSGLADELASERRMDGIFRQIRGDREKVSDPFSPLG